MKFLVSLAIALLLCSASAQAATLCPDIDRSACVPKMSEQDVARTLTAATRGDAQAQFTMGDLYGFGDGVAQSWEEALKWYAKAAAQGSAKAEFEVGLIYDAGRGVPSDCTKALPAFQKSADQGYAAAEAFLGHMYTAGRCAKQDSTAGVQWLEKAAAQGHVDAQGMLCDAFYSGVGAGRDYVEAEFWCSVMAHGGNTATAFWRDAVDANLPADEKTVADKRAAEWLKAHPTIWQGGASAK